MGGKRPCVEFKIIYTLRRWSKILYSFLVAYAW